MVYRKIGAAKIFDGRKLWKNHVLIIQSDGTVEAIVPEAEVSKDEVEKVEGILTPGFINCHCHLELSHLKDVIPPHSGLVPFLISVVKKRRSIIAGKEAAIVNAEREMHHNGMVAVADICNTTDALAVKNNSSLEWYNLIEVINFYDSNLHQQLADYLNVLEAYRRNHLAATLTPHAPYSVSAATFQELNKQTAGRIISVHNQETAAENELFQHGSGDFLQLYSEFADGRTPFAVSGRSSLQTWLPHFTKRQTVLLVHNTFITEEDILFAKEHAEMHRLKLIYCLCPNANLYIENVLPPVDLLIKHNCHIVVGTDSYSSNWQLSIAAELKTLLDIPYLADMEYHSLEMLLQWATLNGAEAMGCHHLGRLEKGLKPGVVMIDEHTFSTQRMDKSA